MKKDLFYQLISTGHIKGHCNKAVLYYNSRDLCCNFVSEDRTVVCKAVSEKFNDGNNFIGDQEIGLPNLESFLKMLKTLGSDVNIRLEREGRNEQYMVLDDSTIQMKYGLITSSQMPKIPHIRTANLTSQPTTIATDKAFITSFYKLSGSVKDCKYLFVTSTEKKLELIFSQSEDYNTGAKVTIDLDQENDPIQVLKFGVDKIRTILYNNRDADSGTILFYGEGMALINFETKNIKTNYYIISE